MCEWLLCKFGGGWRLCCSLASSWVRDVRPESITACGSIAAGVQCVWRLVALLLMCSLKLVFWELLCGAARALEGHPLLLCAERLEEPLSFWEQFFLVLVLNHVNESKIIVAIVDSQNWGGGWCLNTHLS